jgi:hypothetical protein
MASHHYILDTLARMVAVARGGRAPAAQRKQRLRGGQVLTRACAPTVRARSGATGVKQDRSATGLVPPAAKGPTIHFEAALCAPQALEIRSG